MNLVVCDDHRLLAECLADLLAARGHRVVATVAHPDDAVRIVTGAGDIDVCLMDLRFAGGTSPGGLAFGAIRAIRASNPATKVVVLSGCAQPFAEARAFEAGAAAFVLKDDDVSRVVDVLERLDRDDAGYGATRLTAREREVLQRLVRGERTRTIAAGMGVSYSTARTHVQNLLHKLGVHSRLEAVALASSHSLVPVGAHVA